MYAVDSSQSPAISVIIVTYNRCEIIETTLGRLAAQTIPAEDFEVIVVDDGSPDNTREVVTHLIDKMPYKLQYFHHENRGPGYTQNRGIKEAASELIILMADDIWAEPRMLEVYLEMHRRHPAENIAILGKCLQSPQLPATILHKYWDPFRFDRFTKKQVLDGLFFLACNISVKKRFLIENGMFKERKGAAHEDIELGYRLGQKGLKIIYNPDALAWHYHTETLEGACKRSYERGRNFDLLSENIPPEIIFPVYNLFSLDAGLRSCAKMLPRECLRVLFFNRLTVEKFWRPVLKKAESNSLLERFFANGITYRGTIYYYMRSGFRDKKRETNTSGG